MPNITLKTDPYDGVSEFGFWAVAPVLATVEFGGHEEGGWTVDCYRPIIDIEFPTPEIHTDEKTAYEAAERLTLLLAPHNEGMTEKHSVISSGFFEMHVFDGLPKYLPEVWPRYE